MKVSKNVIKVIKERMKRIKEIRKLGMVFKEYKEDLLVEYDRLGVCLEILEGKRLVR